MTTEMETEIKKDANEFKPDSDVFEPQVEGNEEQDNDEPKELPIEKQCDVEGCHVKKEYAVRKGHKVCFNLCQDHVGEYIKTNGLKRKPKYI